MSDPDPANYEITNEMANSAVKTGGMSAKRIANLDDCNVVNYDRNIGRNIYFGTDPFFKDSALTSHSCLFIQPSMSRPFPPVKGLSGDGKRVVKSLFGVEG